MSSGNGPYFIEGADLRGGTESSIYPELGQPSAPDPQMYALAGGALQAHQERSLITGLLQAANEAADHEVQSQTSITQLQEQQHQDADQEQGSRPFEPSIIPPSLSTGEGPPRNTRKRKRGKGESASENNMEDPPSPPKAHRGQYSTSTASALFRRPSATSKKYTRPPMSKMFVSLELSAEDFLQLQSAAKGYMLHPDYPDRRDTVGQRGKGDSELVKLRLWNCVKGFLEEEGSGARFFGPEVQGDEGAQRTMIWPRDKNAIIGAITPLMRRMVTNERQRVYAIETRKGGEEGDSAAKQRKLGEEDIEERTGNVGNQQGSLFERLTGLSLASYDTRELYLDSMLTPTLENFAAQMDLPDEDVKSIFAAISHHIRIYHQDASLNREDCSHSCGDSFLEHIINAGMLDHGKWYYSPQADPKAKRDSLKTVLREVFRTIQFVLNRRSPIGVAPKSGNAISDASASSSLSHRADLSMILQLNLLQGGKRLGPRRDVQADTCPYLHTVVQQATTFLMGPNSIPPTKVTALCPEGLVTIEDDKSWERVMELTKGAEWMDGEMKVLVELV